MLSKLSNSVKQAALYGASIALMKGISLLMLPFIAHHLSPEDFGRLEIITTLALIGSVLIGMGLEDTLYRFAGSETDQKKRNQAGSEIFCLTIIIASAVILFGWQLADFIASLFPNMLDTYHVKLVIFMLAFEGCIAIPLGWLRMHDKALTYFIFATGRACLHALLVVVFLLQNKGISGILEAGLIAILIQVFLLGFMQFRQTGIHFKLSTVKHSLIYSIPIVGSGLLAFVLNGLDRWFIADYSSLEDVAQYGVAFKFSLAMILLLQPFMMWWHPRRFIILQRDNGKSEAARYISLGIILAFSISVVVGIVAPYLIHWLLPNSYHGASQYIIGILLVMLFKEIATLVNIGCFNGKTTSTQFFINTIGAIVGLCLMFFLAPMYKVWGIIYALIFAQFFKAVLFYYFSQHYLPLPYKSQPILLYGISCFLIFTIYPDINTLFQFISALLIVTLVLFTTATFLRLIPFSFNKINKLLQL